MTTSETDAHFDPGDEAPSPDPLLEEILGNYIDRLNAGEVLNLKVIREEHPSLAGELWEQLQVFRDATDDSIPDPTLGTFGEFTLRRELGRGGMGVVYEAWQSSMDRAVALKVLPPALAADTKTYTRFLREAKTAGQLQHPNVVPVFSAGVDGGTPWYSMEYIEGPTLAEVIEDLSLIEPGGETPFGPKLAVDYHARLARAFAAVAGGLQHAHSAKVIHRDVKPSNLILDSDGKLRILDFGLAILEGQDSLTFTGDIVGTPLYMSPEQARQRRIPVDHRTDIYSLGVTLYEVLTGRPPFRGKTHADTLSQIIDREPTELRKIEPRVPRDLETIVLKCLRKEAGDRYGTAEALEQDLDRLVRGDPVEARPRTSLERWTGIAWRHRGKIITTTTILLLLVALGWFAFRFRRQERDRLEIAYPEKVIEALMKLQFASVTGDHSSPYVLGLQPWEGQHGIRSILQRYQRIAGQNVSGESSLAIDLITEAAQELSEAAGWLPERADAYWHRARCHVILGDDAAALQDLNRALEARPDLVPAMLLKATLLERGDRHEEAREIRARIDALPREGWGTLWLAAQRLAARGRARAAVIAFREARGALHDDTLDGPKGYVGAELELRIGRGLMLLEAGEPVEALVEISIVRDHFPAWEEAALLESRARLQLGGEENRQRVGEALTRLHKATRFSDSVAYRAGLLYEDSLPEEARGWFQRIQWAPELREFLLSHALYSLEGIDAGLEALREASERHPDSLLLALGLAGNLVFSGRGTEEGLERLADRLLAFELDPPEVRLAAALCLASTPRRVEAFRICEEIESAVLATEDSWTHMILALVHWRLGDPERALELSKRSVELFESGQTYHNLARIQLSLGRYQEALASMDRVLEFPLYAGDKHWARAVILGYLGKNFEAIASYERHLEARPGHSTALAAIGDIYRSMDKLDEALDYYEQALDVHPEEARALRGKVKLAEKRDFGTALALLHDEMKRNSAWAKPHRVLGDLRRSRKEHEDALSAYERAVGLDSRDYDAQLGLAICRGELGDFRGAIEGLLEARSLRSRSPHPPHHLGVNYRKLNEYGESLIHQRRALELEPSATWVHHELRLLLEEGREALPPRALEDLSDLLEKQLVTGQGDPSLHFGTLALASSPDKLRDIALRVADSIRARISENPTRDENYLALAEALDRAGNRAEAIRTVERALERPDCQQPLQESLRKLRRAHAPDLVSFQSIDDSIQDRSALEAFRVFATDPEHLGQDFSDRMAYLEARLLQRAGDFPEATARFEEIVKRLPTEPRPVLQLSECLRSTGGPEELARAESTLRELLERRPDCERRIGDLWFEIALGDLRMTPYRALARLKKSGGSFGGTYDNLRWLLERLSRRESLRINSGGLDYESSVNGEEWSRDRFFISGSPSDWTLRDLQDIEATEDEPLYQDARWFHGHPLKPSAYRIPLPRGRYAVTLHFAEIVHRARGERTFDVLLEGERVLEDYEAIDASFATKAVEEFDVSVTDGFLEVEFGHEKGLPMVSAIEIIPRN